MMQKTNLNVSRNVLLCSEKYPTALTMASIFLTKFNTQAMLAACDESISMLSSSALQQSHVATEIS